MCGFAGVVVFDQGADVSLAQLRAMSERIAHRGPDAEGIWVNHDRPASRDEPRLRMAFRRLAVIDLDPRSNQPMHSQDGRFTLVFNGEIYNFRELRDQLTGVDDRYRWRTQGDAEVILRAYETWGDDCFDRFNGMFAIAIWDSVHKGLVLARDRTGQKPLYVARTDSRVVFASERGALVSLDPMSAEVSDESLTHYFRYGYIDSHDGVMQVKPGHAMTIAGRAARSSSYLTLRDSVPTDDVRSAVERAVRRQMVSDVPLGVFLSGGVDSSIVALCASRERKIDTFSIGFDDPRYDESKYAREVAKHIGSAHHEFRAEPNLAADLPALARAYGEPFADSSMLPTFLLCRQTRQHVTVALSGDGGDELFGGYDRYRAMVLADEWSGYIPDFLAQWIGHRFSGGHPKSKLTRLARFIESMGLDQPARYDRLVRLFDDRTLKKLFPRASASEPDIARVFAKHAATSGTRQACTRTDRATYLPGDLHTKVDRASMLHALEVRAPFMDVDLLHLADSLKDEQLDRKQMLRAAFAGDLPASVFKRPKMGFALPIGDWLRTSLRDMLLDHIRATNSMSRTRLNLPFVEQLIEAHQSARHDHSQRLFAILMLELWAKHGR
jgi:asparagine synthase (glutamine-hydrolysing)